MTASETNRAIEAVWRIEASRLIAGLARMTRDVGIAEELAQEALVAALGNWPEAGIPDKPGAWLMATAKRRALDLFRRDKMLERKHAELARELEAEQNATPDIEGAIDDDIGDDLLSLIFTACHPVLRIDARIALTLRVVGGLTTEEIARAFLTSEPTVAQRIVRAKRVLAEAGVPFEVPHGADRDERLVSVLQVIYLMFNEGYAATAGDDWMRPQLCEEAMRVGRILVGLMPDESEVHGLSALMELQASRLGARTDRSGNAVLLPDQERSRWNRLMITRGLAALERAEALSQRLRPYALQAAIAACHARAATAADTDWRRIASLYAELAERMPSPIVELNRAVAVSMAFGPEPALLIVDGLKDEPKLAGYHLLPAVRGDLLEKVERFDEARASYQQAALLARNRVERDLLIAKAEKAAAAAG